MKRINSLAFTLLNDPTLTSINNTGKIIALTVQTFVGKVMPLLFNTLSRFVIGEGNGTPLQYSCLENPVDGDCSHEIKRHVLFVKKTMTNLDSILTNRDITLPTKVCIVKAMVFPVVMYG